MWVQRVWLQHPKKQIRKNSEKRCKLKKINLSTIPRFCVEGLPKILDFVYFVLFCWQTDKKIRNPKAELQGPKVLF